MRLLVLTIGFFTWLPGQSQTVDVLACQKFEDTLNILKKYFENHNSDPHLFRLDAIDFLIKITEIPYEGRITFVGREFPEESFFDKCKSWLQKNRVKLKYDKTQNKILIIDDCKILGYPPKISLLFSIEQPPVVLSVQSYLQHPVKKGR